MKHDLGSDDGIGRIRPFAGAGHALIGHPPFDTRGEGDLVSWRQCHFDDARFARHAVVCDEVAPGLARDDLEMAREVARLSAQELAALAFDCVADLDTAEEVSGGEIVTGVWLDQGNAQRVVAGAFDGGFEVFAQKGGVAHIREGMRSAAIDEGHVAIGARLLRGWRTAMLACSRLHEERVVRATGHGEAELMAARATAGMGERVRAAERMRRR